MSFGCSVVGNASTIGIEMSPTPPLIFTGAKKCEIWHRLKHHSTLSRMRFKVQQDIQNLKQKCNAVMSWPSLVKSASTHLWKRSVSFVPTLKTCSRSLGQILKSQYLRRGLLDCVQIWYRVPLRRRRNTANVSGQRSKVKVTARVLWLYVCLSYGKFVRLFLMFSVHVSFCYEEVSDFQTISTCQDALACR